MVLIHPKSARAHRDSFERALAGLRYGGIGVNTFAGVVYGLVSTTWGAYPGHPLDEIESGRGVVHNTSMFDHPQKSIVRAPFRISPTPAWFTDHRTCHLLGRALTRFEANPSLLPLLDVMRHGIRG